MHDYSLKNVQQLFWNRTMIETFIKLLKENECLYNRSHPDYNNKIIKAEVLGNILQKMKFYLHNLKLKDVQDKLKTIRKQFSTEVSLINNAETLGNTYVPKLWCFDQLQFLRKHMNISGEDKSDPNEQNNDSDDVYSDSSDIPHELNLLRNTQEYRWEREDTKIFINLFKKFKLLYDPKNKHYNNNKLKYKARHMLMKETQKIDPKINFRIVDRKIKYLRHQYVLEQRRIKKGKESNETYTPRLWCFHLLTFFDNYITDCEPSTETTLYTKFKDDKLIEKHQLQGINNTSELKSFNNESYEIEQIQKVVIENEVGYDEEMPIANTTQNKNAVVDYECDNTFNFDTHDVKQYDYEEKCDKIETNFVDEIIQPQISTNLENNKESIKSIKKIVDQKYEWLGDLVVSQLGIISPRYHNELATDVQSLIRKYITKSKTNEDETLASNIPGDIFLQESPKVSFNLRIL